MKNNTLITISNAEYRKHEAMSKSDFALLLKNPNDFWNVKYNGKTLKQTQGMLVGSCIHAFLEGEEYKDLIVLPSTEKGEIRLEGGALQKKMFQDFEKSPYFKSEEWDIITQDDKGKETFKFYHRHYKTEEDLPENAIAFSSMKVVEEMIEALKKQEFYVKNALNPKVLKEKSIFFEYNGVKLKARMDGIKADQGSKQIVIYDYKSISSLEPRDVLESIKKYAYNLQAYIYMLAVKSIPQFNDYKITFQFIFQSKVEPNSCSAVELSLDEITQETLYGRLLSDAKEMLDKGIEVYKKYLSKGTEKEWLNETTILPLDINHNLYMRKHNEIVANHYPHLGYENFYDFENGELIKNIQ